MGERGTGAEPEKTAPGGNVPFGTHFCFRWPFHLVHPRPFRSENLPCHSGTIRADKIIRNKLVFFRNQQLKKQQEEQERLEKLQAKEQARLNRQAEKKGVAPIELPPAQVAELPKGYGDIKFKKQMKIVVENFDEIPREFLMPDMDKIKLAVKNGQQIAGIKLVEEEITSL